MTVARQHPRPPDRLAHVVDRLTELLGDPLRDYLWERVATYGRALDLGCGSGHHAALLAEHYDCVLAVDGSAAMLRLACRKRSRRNIRYEHRDLLDVTPDRDGWFDLVFSAQSLHHVTDLPRTLEHVKRLVRPGGQAILVDTVDARRQVPRPELKAQARRSLLLDLRHSRRPVTEALEIYRLSTHPALLDHVSTDMALTPGEFEQVYGAVFPAATITSLARLRALCWQRS